MPRQSQTLHRRLRLDVACTNSYLHRARHNTDTYCNSCSSSETMKTHIIRVSPVTRRTSLSWGRDGRDLSHSHLCGVWGPLPRLSKWWRTWYLFCASSLSYISRKILWNFFFTFLPSSHLWISLSGLLARFNFLSFHSTLASFYRLSWSMRSIIWAVVTTLAQIYAFQSRASRIPCSFTPCYLCMTMKLVL